MLEEVQSEAELLASLTPRQRQVIDLVGQGHSIKMAAKMLDISPRTVEQHLRNIREKFDVRTTAHLAELYRQVEPQIPYSIDAEVRLEGTPITLGQPGISEATVERIASSTWTGRRTVREQVAVISSFGPLALQGVEMLAAAIEGKRFNDPETHEALAALKELHHALGELIHAAECGHPLDKIWAVVEGQKERVFSAVSKGANVMIAAPILAIGTAQVLGWLSGEPITGQMLTTLAGSSVVASAFAGKKK